MSDDFTPYILTEIKDDEDGYLFSLDGPAFTIAPMLFKFKNDARYEAMFCQAIYRAGAASRDAEVTKWKDIADQLSVFAPKHSDSFVAYRDAVGKETK